MNDFHFELNRSGVRKLLKSKEMQNGLSSVAFAAQSRLGDGYTASYYTADTRAVAEIAPIRSPPGKRTPAPTPS